ncbi:MAG: D-sedoheptulose 7-phosphate isomerase [Thermodesulfobacteriota bacterium]|nr:D-sedoheptulose 7-phosphate isomerase [Thermodesulfobacteriota bacterium]
MEVFQQVVMPMVKDIERCAQLMCQALRQGNKILVMGNGGSAADAQHFAAELVGRFLKNRKALPAIALTTDTSILTAVANDFGYEQVFSRQVEALAHSGDIVVGISTSGNSINVQRALDLASELNCKTVALLGCDGGEIKFLVDLALTVAVNETPHIQEAHLTLIHILCDLIESDLFADD